MPTVRRGKPLSARAFAMWTLAFFSVLCVSTWSVMSGRSQGGFAAFLLAFMVGIIGVMVLSWNHGPLTRLLPAPVASALASIWPLHRWLTTGEWKPLEVCLYVTAMLNGLLLLSAAGQYVRFRGWVVDSPLRRQLGVVLIFAMLASDVAKWPAGAWHHALTAAWSAGFLSLWFWPSRKRRAVLSSEL